VADGVKWDIDIDPTTAKVVAADKATAGLEAQLKKTDATAAKTGAEFGRLGGHAEKAGHEAHSLFREIFSAELAVHAVEKLTEKVIDLGKEIIKASAEEERMMRVFEAASGSKELGRMNEEWADLLSKKTEFTEAETESAFIGLKRVGASDQETKLAMKAAADVAAVSTNRAEAFQATIEAFERIQRTGVISNRALAPLGIGVKDFKALDSMKGLSDKAIKQRMEEGKVDRNDLFRLIMSRTGEKAIGQRAADNADLLGTKLQKLQELPERFFKKLADTKAIKDLSGALDKMLEKIDPDSPIGKKISGFLQTAFEGGVAVVEKLADVVEGIDFDSLAATVKDDVVPAFKAMAEMIAPTVRAVEKIIHGLHEAHDFLMGPDASNKAIDDFEARQRAANARAKAEDEPTFLQKGKDMGGGATAWHGKFHVVGDQGAAGAATAAPKFEDAGETWGESVEKGYRKATKTHSPSMLFADMGKMAAAGFMQGVDGAAPDVSSAIERAFAMKSGPGGARAATGGGISVTFGDVHVQVDGGRDGEEQGRKAADAFEKRVRESLISLLDQMRMEAGA
jgi:hypothetical protein